jgi:hypothetical protein
MKKIVNFLLVAIIAVAFTSCETVHPNYVGVLMSNFGKNGKSDFTPVKGRVNTMAPGTALYQVPLFEQRANFGDQVLHLKAADNTEFSAKPLYSFRVIEARAVDVVFENSRLGADDGFMTALEDNILEPHIYDIIKEESRRYSTDTLMADGGSLLFEQRVQALVKKSFESKGLELISFSSNLDFSSKVKAKIDTRNEVNTNITVLDQKILEQKKKNELADLQATENIIRSKGLTPEILQERVIDGWIEKGCPTPQVIDGNSNTMYNMLPSVRRK